MHLCIFDQFNNIYNQMTEARQNTQTEALASLRLTWRWPLVFLEFFRLRL